MWRSYHWAMVILMATSWSGLPQELLSTGLAIQQQGSIADTASGKQVTINFQRPFRLKVLDEAIDTGKFGGHSSPCIVDINNDGLDDLVVGSFAGRFEIYRNIGTQPVPRYSLAGYLRAGGVDARLYIYCCIGSQPRFADLDGDQVLDLIANSYDPGHCHLFRGLQAGGFAESVELVDAKGDPIRSSPLSKHDWASFGSFFETTDWDADGDLDLLIGCFDGALKLRINQGDSRTIRFSHENQTVSGLNGPVKVGGHCCPVVGDLDGDGLWDIVIGSEDGSVSYYRNRGAKGAPAFEDGVILVAPSPDLGYERIGWGEDDVYPGIRSQVDLADINGDGRLDLLVGDFYTALDVRNDLPEAKKQALTKLVVDRRARQKAFYAELSLLEKEINKRYPGDQAGSQESKAELIKAEREHFATPSGQQFQNAEEEFYKSLKPFITEQSSQSQETREYSKEHGHVWVYIQKSDSGHALKAPTANDPVGVSLAVEKSEASSGEFELRLRLEVLEPYEIQTPHASPPKKPTQIELKLPNGFEPIGDWQFPKPMRSTIPGTTKSYWGTFECTRKIKLAAGTKVPADSWIECSVMYQACDTTKCLRETKTVVKLLAPTP